MLTDLRRGKFPAKFKDKLNHEVEFIMSFNNNDMFWVHLQAELIEMMLRETAEDRPSAEFIRSSSHLKSIKKAEKKNKDAVIPVTT